MAQIPCNKSEYGFIAEYIVQVETSVDAVIAGRYFITPGAGLDGFRAGIFGRRNDNKGNWKIELTYAQFRSEFTVTDLKPYLDTAWFGFDPSYYGSFQHRLFKAGLTRGFKILKNVQLDAGLTTSFQLKENYYSELRDRLNGNLSHIGLIKVEMAEAFKPIVMSGNACISYVYGPLHVYFGMERSFTSFIGRVKHDGSQYPVNLKVLTWSLGFCYGIISNQHK